MIYARLMPPIFAHVLGSDRHVCGQCACIANKGHGPFRLTVRVSLRQAAYTVQYSIDLPSPVAYLDLVREAASR